MSGAEAAAAARDPKALGWIRRLPQRFVDYAWDNPSAEHDARAILSSPKVALWLGIEVLLIVAGCLFTTLALPQMEPEFRHLAVNVGPGSYMTATTFIVLAAFLTLVVPLRASGLLEGPRWRGYMDQLVTTGVSPLRYFAGKWATSQPFFLAMLGATLPFIVLFGLLGDASWTRTAISYGLLYCYCNLLLVVAFGLGVLLHEVAAILLTWLLFGSFVILEFTPVPSSLAALTPIRFLIQPFTDIVLGSAAGVVGPSYGAAHAFGLSVPWPVWALVVWGTLASVLGTTCLLGPLHAHVPGMNNFGSVVLPGDKRRVFFSRLRPFLTRRVELSFLFENRGPRLMRWTLPLRSLQQLTLLVLLTVMLYATVFSPALLAQSQREVVVALHAAATSLVLLVSVFVFASGRTDALQRFRLGSFAIPQVLFDAASFVCFLAALMTLHVIGFAAAWEHLEAPTVMWRTITPDDVFSHASSILAILSVVAVSTFLFLKVVGSRVLSRGAVFVVAGIYLLVLFILPTFALGAFEAIRSSEQLAISRLALPFFVLSEVSPAVQIALVWGGPPGLDTSHWLVGRSFWLWHGVWIAFLGAMVWSGHRSLALEARVHAGEASGVPADGPPPACAACHSLRRVPAGWTWWGGALATRLWGTVRCVDCRAEFSPRTGAPDHRARFLTLAARIVLVAVLTIAVAWGLVLVLVP